MCARSKRGLALRSPQGIFIVLSESLGSILVIYSVGDHSYQKDLLIAANVMESSDLHLFLSLRDYVTCDISKTFSDVAG